MIHIYETASYYSGGPYDNWAKNAFWEEYLDIMETYMDKVVLEVTGHDHLMSLRYSKVDESDQNSANFLNKIIFPPVTSNSRTNPAFSTF